MASRRTWTAGLVGILVLAAAPLGASSSALGESRHTGGLVASPRIGIGSEPTSKPAWMRHFDAALRLWKRSGVRPPTIRRVHLGTVSTKMSDNTDVAVARPDVFVYTGGHPGEPPRYVVKTSFHWLNSSWRSDCNALACGSFEGFGVRWDSRMAVKTSFLSVCPQVGDDCDFPAADDASSYGAGFRYGTTKLPDDSPPGLYDGFRGSMDIDVRPPDCGTTVDLYARYYHTWSNTQFTGFSIDLTGFGVSWTTTENHWSRASDGGVWTRHCKSRT